MGCTRMSNATCLPGCLLPQPTPTNVCSRLYDLLRKRLPSVRGYQQSCGFYRDDGLLVDEKGPCYRVRPRLRLKHDGIRVDIPETAVKDGGANRPSGCEQCVHEHTLADEPTQDAIGMARASQRKGLRL